uniref:Uncharacterized protein n=1 Tax=Ralstonia solanacearum TaxID=305 RepID=A0A0S4WR32_RALSL|nr:protein of unknown function [Ralstonia solanacearum]
MKRERIFACTHLMIVQPSQEAYFGSAFANYNFLG